MTGPKSCDQSLVTTTPEPDTQFGKNNLVKNVSYFIHLLFPAIIVTGTYFGNSRSVEALREDGSSLCTLPDLPNNYYYHTQSGLVTCGGGTSSIRHGCIFFWKILIFPKSRFMRCFQNSKTSSNFELQIRIFSKKLRKICKKWGKNTKIKDNEQKK